MLRHLAETDDGWPGYASGSERCLNQLRLEWMPYVSPELQQHGAAGNLGED